jgi:hypothetical protein
MVLVGIVLCLVSVGVEALADFSDYNDMEGPDKLMRFISLKDEDIVPTSRPCVRILVRISSKENKAPAQMQTIMNKCGEEDRGPSERQPYLTSVFPHAYSMDTPLLLRAYPRVKALKPPFMTIPFLSTTLKLFPGFSFRHRS